MDIVLKLVSTLSNLSCFKTTKTNEGFTCLENRVFSLEEQVKNIYKKASVDERFENVKETTNARMDKIEETTELKIQNIVEKTDIKLKNIESKQHEMNTTQQKISDQILHNSNELSNISFLLSNVQNNFQNKYNNPKYKPWR